MEYLKKYWDYMHVYDANINGSVNLPMWVANKEKEFSPYKTQSLQRQI